MGHDTTPWTQIDVPTGWGVITKHCSDVYVMKRDFIVYRGIGWSTGAELRILMNGILEDSARVRSDEVPMFQIGRSRASLLNDTRWTMLQVGGFTLNFESWGSHPKNPGLAAVLKDIAR